MNNQFKCQLCKKSFSRLSDLSKHIGVFHKDISKKEYYDKYFKYLNKEKEGLCLECNKETKYSESWQRGYNLYCCDKCKRIGSHKESEKTNLKRYGVKHQSQRPDVKEKIKEFNIKKYGNVCPMQNEKIQKQIREKNLKNLGVELPFQSKEIQEKSSLTREIKYGAKYTYQSKELQQKIKNTSNKKYGYDYPIQSKEIQGKIKNTNNIKYGVDWQICSELTIEKIKLTMLKNYGVENCMHNKDIRDKKNKTNLEKYGFEEHLKNKDIREKIKDTNLKNYGVEYPSQRPEIYKKIQKTSLVLKQFRNTNIWYQGSYELDFLERYYDKYTDIQRGPSIKYTYKGKQKVYHSDFYLPSKNLIVECKNSYLAKRDKYHLQKKKIAAKIDFNWIMIIDKNYDKFEKLIKT